MSALDELAKEVLEASAKVDNLSGRTVHIRYNDSLRIADAILAAGYSKPRTISTVEELDALPNGSVLKHDELGHVAVRWSVQDWVIAGADGDGHYEDIRAALPLTLLYTPKES